MSYLKYLFSDWGKLDKIRVYYSIVTESGNEILEIKETIKPNCLIMAKRGAYGLYFSDNISKLKEFKPFLEQMKNRADTLLTEYRKKQKKELKNGFLISGNYIAKVTYYYYCDSDYITYEEFKQWSNKR